MNIELFEKYLNEIESEILSERRRKGQIDPDSKIVPFTDVRSKPKSASATVDDGTSRLGNDVDEWEEDDEYGDEWWERNKHKYKKKDDDELFVEALEWLIDIDYKKKDFKKVFSKEYVPWFKEKIYKNKDREKELKALAEIVSVMNSKLDVLDVTDMKQCIKEIERLKEWYEDKYYEIPQYQSDVEPEGDVKVLMEFLNMPLDSTAEVLQKFGGSGSEEYLYIEGSLPENERVVLVAHADTVWDGYAKKYKLANPYIRDGVIKSSNFHAGLGADDRAGCAIIWLLKDSGHSIVITTGEEVGRVGAKALMVNKPIADKLNQTHNFMIQFDRQGANDYKCYDVGTKEFRDWLNSNTPFKEPSRSSFTDICTLCRDICGVNLSVGYYDEHRSTEKVIIKEWQRTLDFTRSLLSKDLPKFKYVEEKPDYSEYNKSRYADYYDDEYGDGYGNYNTNKNKSPNAFDNEEEDTSMMDDDYDDDNPNNNIYTDVPPDDEFFIDEKTQKRINRFVNVLSPKDDPGDKIFSDYLISYNGTSNDLVDELRNNGFTLYDIMEQLLDDWYKKYGREYWAVDEGWNDKGTVYYAVWKKKKK